MDLGPLTEQIKDLREDFDHLNALAEPALVNGTPAIRSTGPNPFPEPPPAKPNRVGAAHAWHTLTRAEAAKAWDTLTCWVDWLIDRYHLEDTVPDCWYRHGALVDELDALRAAWTSAYLHSNASIGEASTWHMLLANGLTRIRGWDRYGCATGTHRDEVPSPTDEPAREARRTYLRADVRAREGPPPAQPVEAKHAPPSDSGSSGDVSGDPVPI